MINRKALTLVEIMVAVAILGAIILPVLGLLDYSNRGTREQDVEGIAANLAKEKMNQLLYVISRTNLIDNSGTETVENIKGNDIAWKYEVYEFSNTELKFKIPKFVFHDPLGCSSGVEKTPASVIDATPDEMSIAEIYPALAGTSLMVDISMTVRWKLPNQSDYDPKNTFKLVARRTFLVTH
jgi:prepilin-type N-terminal cleavage/methylation domain-containing protein